MLLLGWVVGKGPTPLDTWFLNLGRAMGQYRWVCLWFTYPPLIAAVLVVSAGVALVRRRWWLAAAVVLAPPLAVVVAQVCKRIFGREKGGSLAYPSGHVTFAVTVLGLFVLVAAAATWAVVVAVAVGLLGVFGQAITHHYFTDTVGAALLGVSMVYAVVILLGDRERAPTPG